MASVKEEKIILVPLKNIVADIAWNSRSGDISADPEVDGSDAKAEHKTNSFKELVASIRDSGGINKDAVKVRMKGDTGKMGLVSGFRRYFAIKEIAEKDGNKEPMIRCLVEELDELQARQENVRENVARQSLKGADLAWSLYEIEKQLKLKKIEPTDLMITNSVGMNQSYGNKLLNIARKVPPAVFEDWRKSDLPLTVPEMVGVSKLGPDTALMKKAYEEAKAKKAPKSGRDKTKMYVDSMKKRAAKLGYLLGSLEREDLINTDNFTFENHITYLVKFKKDATPKQIETIAKAAEKAYNDALKAEPNADAEGDDE